MSTDYAHSVYTDVNSVSERIYGESSNPWNMVLLPNRQQPSMPGWRNTDANSDCSSTTPGITPENTDFYPSYNPATGEMLAETVQAGQAEVDAAVSAARQAFQHLEHDPWARPGALPLCNCPQHPKAHPPVGRAGSNGQWQAPARIARYRCPITGPPFLLLCRLGAVDGERAERLPAGRRGRADHPLEFPAC